MEGSFQKPLLLLLEIKKQNEAGSMTTEPPKAGVIYHLQCAGGKMFHPQGISY